MREPKRVEEAPERPGQSEHPSAPDPAFEARVNDWVERTGTPVGLATLLAALREADVESPAVRRLVEGAETGELTVGRGREELWLAELAQRLYGPRGP